MSGFQVIYKLEPGEQYKFWNGCIIVAHPDRPPKIIHSDGTTEIIQPFTALAEGRGVMVERVDGWMDIGPEYTTR